MHTAGFSETSRYDAPAQHEQKGLRAPEDWTAKVIEQIFSDSIANQHNCWKPMQLERPFTNSQVNDILNNGLELFDSKSEKHSEEHVRGKHGKHDDQEKPGLDHPLRLGIDLWMRFMPESSYKNALSLFPELAKLPNAELLMKGILRNELFHYDRTDAGEDVIADVAKRIRPNHMPDVRDGHGHVIKKGDDLTLGYSQLSVNGLIKLEHEFPKEMGWMKGRELQALENPELAPLLVAATLMHIMKMYKNHGITPNVENLAYGYNPDLPGKTPGTHNLLPTAEELKKSSHAKNVLHHMERAREQND